MNGLSVIILSKRSSNLIPCIKSIRKCESVEASHVIVVDDGVDWVGSSFVSQIQTEGNNLHCVPGQKPFIFARNCNLGIVAAGNDDVVLLNDDALLQTSEGFTQLQKLAEDHPEYGMIAPVTNVTGQPLQKPHGVGLREVQHIAFVCVYVPRRTLNTVGLLDERFVTYGWDDRDYCKRVKDAGLKIGVYDFCFVDHASLTSTFRGNPHAAGNIEDGRKIFEAKWGVTA